MLRLVWNSRLQEIRVQLMGKVQLEVLQRRIADRFGLAVEFGPGSIVYRETIAAPVEGVGHFEPLRHYAEVHLLLEPAPQGSGLTFATACSEDDLSPKLAAAHSDPPGGERAPGGADRLAGHRPARHSALRPAPMSSTPRAETFGRPPIGRSAMGLMRAKSTLLEPWYRFRLEVPAELVGRAMADLQRFGGAVDPPESAQDGSVLTGRAPVAQLADYPEEVAAYTRGRGRISLQLAGYYPCHNQDEVIAQMGYNPEADLDNSPDSVFCAHGGGFVVKWNQVPEHMHLSWAWNPPKEEADTPAAPIRRGGATYSGSRAEEKALEAIFRRTYGGVKPRAFLPQAELRRENQQLFTAQTEIGDTFLLVDGYNIIFAWDELNKLAREDLDAALDPAHPHPQQLPGGAPVQGDSDFRRLPGQGRRRQRGAGEQHLCGLHQAGGDCGYLY